MCEAQEKMPARVRVRDRDRRKCMRCGEKSQYIIRDITHCQRCFVSSVQLKLTRGINAPLLQAGGQRGNPTVRPRAVGGGVVVGLSGGAGSTALLDHLISRQYVARPGARYDITRGDKEPVWTRGWAVHVVFPSDNGCGSTREQLRRRVEDAGMVYMEVHAEDVFDPDFQRRLASFTAAQGSSDFPTANSSSASVSPRTNPTPIEEGSSSYSSSRERLIALLALLPPPSRPTMQQHILDALLVTIAQTLPEVKHVLVGETATREAQRVVVSTAQGRGRSLPLDLAPTLLPGLPDQAVTASKGLQESHQTRIIRIPAAHDVSIKEAALYCHAQGIPTFNWRRWESGRGRKDATSIEGLTERFIQTLSTRHPATVGAITRTAGKLQFVGERDVLCPLCQRPIDKDADEWKARASLTSLPGRGTPRATDAPAVSEMLCYACATTMRDIRGDPELPVWVRERRQGLGPRTPEVVQGAQEPLSTAQMRAQIAKFILDE